MKKMYFFLAMCMVASLSLQAQTVVFSDNFDTYTAGAYLAQSNSAWTTWDNAPGTSQDGVISSAQAASAPNSLYITGSNDQVYPFGNYTSGHYTLTFNYYVPSTGNGAYFNIQHVLLTQWALECYFNSTGGGYLTVGGSNYNFTSPADAWFPIEFDVDMDNNTASLTVNNVSVYSWPFNYQANNTNGTNQLAGINFYAGAPSGTGTYYVDDFVVTEVSAALVGHFAVNPETNINVTIGPDGGSSTVEVSNPGDAPVDYRIVPTYEVTNVNTTPTGADTLSYCYEYYSSLGFTNGAEWEAAVGFPASQMSAHVGRTLNAIRLHIGAGADEGVTNAKIRIYGMSSGIGNGPGEVLYEQAFTPVAGWNIVELATPFVINGGDLWFGASAVQPAEVYTFSFDDMPGNSYSAWYKTGSGWNTLANMNAAYNFNWCIKGVVDGTPITPWMTLSPAEGTLAAAQNQTVTINYNTAGMNAGDVKNGTLHFFSTDYDNGVVTVDVTLTVSGAGVDQPSRINISLYPNPTADNLNITSEEIETVEIYNMDGKLVYSGNHSGNHVTIPTEGFAAGLYTVKVMTAHQTSSHKIVIQ